MVGTARSIKLPGGYACKPNARSFCAPNRSIAVPHGRRRASEGQARGDELGDQLSGLFVRLFAADAIIVPIELRRITGIAAPDGGCSGSPGLRAISKVCACTCCEALPGCGGGAGTASTMAMVIARLAIVVATRRI